MSEIVDKAKALVSTYEQLLEHTRNERDRLAAELARLQRNEDCVQRLIVWAAENGWNGVDNSKILDSFIIGLFDELRAELSAAKERGDGLYLGLRQTLEGLGGVAQPGVSEAFLILGVPGEAAALKRVNTALAADNARLRKVLEEIGKQLDACKTFVVGGCMGQTTDNIMKATVYHRVPYMLRELVLDALSTAPAQSLAAHDAALLRDLCDDALFHEDANVKAKVRAEADRIERAGGTKGAGRG